MYSLQGYEEMVDDSVRMTAYAAALQAVISPTSIVVDLGAGTGVMSLLACQYGAKRVYAIEPNDAVVVARQNAAANGMSDRISFLQGVSTAIELPEKADVVVADLRGVLPLFNDNINSLIHARDNLVAPGGALIPQRDRLWTAVISLPEATKSHEGWNRSSCGLSLSAANQYLVNRPRKHRPAREQLLTAPACWATLDYATIQSPHVANVVDFRVNRSGVAAGIAMWFDATLWGDIGFSNRPDKNQAIYGAYLFPLSRSIDVEAGDSIRVAITARHQQEDYLWQWDTVIRSRNSGDIRAAFQQSSFFGTPLVAERLRKTADKYRPDLSVDGRITHFILSLMNGSRDNGSIAESVVREFPARFPDLQSALTRVGQVCRQFCE